MKAIRVTNVAAVILLCGTIAPAWAQHEGGGKQERGERQDERQSEQHAEQPQHSQRRQAQDQTQPRPQQAQQAQPARQQEQHMQQDPQQPKRYPQRAPEQQVQQSRQDRQQRQRTEQQARSWQQQKGWAYGGGSQGHATFAQVRSQNWSYDHRSWAQRGGYGGYYIPQSTFGISFGSQHFFRLGGMPSMYMGYPRFSTGGFSFLIVDPWPGEWSQSWYSSDDVYVDYDYSDDGYYLYNRRYPRQRLAITVVL